MIDSQEVAKNSPNRSCVPFAQFFPAVASRLNYRTMSQPRRCHFSCKPRAILVDVSKSAEKPVIPAPTEHHQPVGLHLPVNGGLGGQGAGSAREVTVCLLAFLAEHVHQQTCPGYPASRELCREAAGVPDLGESVGTIPPLCC